MKVLTMTRILSDIDTVAMMGYTDAPDRNEYVRDFCRENYNHAGPVVTSVVAKAFRETTRVFSGHSEQRRSIQMESLY